MCPLQIASSNTCPLSELYSSTTGKRENGKREGGEPSRADPRSDSAQEPSEDVRGWRAGGSVSERGEGRESEQVRKMG